MHVIPRSDERNGTERNTCAFGDIANKKRGGNTFPPCSTPKSFQAYGSFFHPITVTGGAMLTTREEDGRESWRRINSADRWPSMGDGVATIGRCRWAALLLARRSTTSAAVVSAVVSTSQGSFPSLLSLVTNLVLTRGQRLTREGNWRAR